MGLWVSSCIIRENVAFHNFQQVPVCIKSVVHRGLHLQGGRFLAPLSIEKKGATLAGRSISGPLKTENEGSSLAGRSLFSFVVTEAFLPCTFLIDYVCVCGKK